MHVKESDIMVNLAGSSPQVDWGGNVVFNFTYAYVFMAMKSMFDPDIPNNDGCTAPIAMDAPLGSVVNCKFPAAVAARMQIGHFLTEIIYRAMADVLPDRVIAGSGGTPANMNVLYGRHGDGRPWHSVRIRGGGMGASSRGDGNYVYIFPANGANTPVEILESDTPLIVEKRELMTDSGGIGRMKGGLGRRMVLKIPDKELLMFVIAVTYHSKYLKTYAIKAHFSLSVEKTKCVILCMKNALSIFQLNFWASSQKLKT